MIYVSYIFVFKRHTRMLSYKKTIRPIWTKSVTWLTILHIQDLNHKYTKDIIKNLNVLKKQKLKTNHRNYNIGGLKEEFEDIV